MHGRRILDPASCILHPVSPINCQPTAKFCENNTGELLVLPAFFLR